jgi:hypothetical protein
MIRFCSVLVTAILLSGCGNFLGNMGERMSSDPDAGERKKAEAARQRPDSK